MSYHHDVTVIGAGWSGIVTTKYMLEEGLTVVTLERRDDCGGLWYYSDDPCEKTTMKSTRTTSSATVSEFSDFPMPEDMGDFPHHRQMLQYLRSYCERFGLLRHMRFNAAVERVERKGGLWFVHTWTKEVYTSRFLVVSTGQPVSVDHRGDIFKNFSGCIYHSKEIKEPIAKHENCKLLIFGGGETAADICTEWYGHTRCIYWSAPRGQHFFRRYSKVLPWKQPQALDKASSWLLTAVAPYQYSKPGLAWICKWTTNGSLLAYQGHGIPEWRNDAPFMHQFINKSGHVLDLVDYVKVVPKGGITSCNGKTVFFADGSSQEFDVVIMCTGYTSSFPFLPEQFIPKRQRDLYKLALDNEEPTLSFVGYVRPVIGSMFGLFEIQARWIAKVFSGHTVLKSKQERLEETKADAMFWQDYFKNTSQRLDELVEAVIYVNDIGRLANVYPDYASLFKRNMYHCYVALVAPFNMALFRLNEPKHRDRAIATLERHRRGTTTPVHLLLVFFLRLVWFDWWLGQLEHLKYRIQISRRWPLIRDSRLVQIANWVWCLPKRLLFDNKTQLPPL